jgi:streptogramin lyase
MVPRKLVVVAGLLVFLVSSAPAVTGAVSIKEWNTGRNGIIFYTDYRRGYLGALDPKNGRVSLSGVNKIGIVMALR